MLSNIKLFDHKLDGITHVAMLDAFHPTRNFERFETEANDTEISSEKFRENPKIVILPKCKTFNQNFLEVAGGINQKNITRGCPLFRKF